MFAFALWDASRRRLLLARDRLGIKPLHYWVGDGQMLFASELGALMASGAVPREIDPRAVEDYFTFFYVPGERSIYRGVRKLPPATTAVWSAGRCTTRRYWRVRYAPPARPGPVDHYTEAYREHLARAVRLQLRADVPLGVFLSGGLDSGSVVAAIARVLNRPCTTFTVSFDDTSYDETPQARLTARAYGTKHHEFRLKPEHLLQAGELVEHFGEPYGPFTLVQSHLISRLSRRHIKVALAGDGGDELFGGYPTYLASRAVRHYLRLPAALRHGFFRRFAGMLPVSDKLLSWDFKVREFVRGAEMFARGHNMAWKVIFDDAERAELLTDEFRRHLAGRDPFAHVRGLVDDAGDATGLQQALYVDQSMFLPDCVLTCTDRMGMAAGQEVRVPILDHEIVEFAATVPDAHKCRRGRTKILLRHALKDWLPAEVLRKPKTGFTAPVPIWLRGPLRGFVRDVLAPDALRRTGMINPACVERLLGEHESARADHARRIWALVDFMLWYERCYERPAGGNSPAAAGPISRDNGGPRR